MDLEFHLVRTLILQPNEKSIRSAKLTKTSLKPVRLPETLSQVPYALPCPQLFVVRSFGIHPSAKLMVCPAGRYDGIQNEHPFSCNSVTWKRNLHADPPVDMFTFRNFTTGEILGEEPAIQADFEPITFLLEYLGDEFELSVELDHKLCLKKPGEPMELMTLLPHNIQVASTDPKTMFMADLFDTTVTSIFVRMSHLLLAFWEVEKVNSMSVLCMIRRFEEQGQPIPEALRIRIWEILQNKQEILGLFTCYLLEPIEPVIPDHIKFLDSFAKAHSRTKKVMGLCERLRNSGRIASFSDIILLLSTELTHCIPLDNTWWRDLEDAISTDQTSEFVNWINELAIAWLRQRSPITLDKPSWGLIDNLKERVFHQLRSLACQLRLAWFRCVKGKFRVILDGIMHPRDAGMVDPASLLPLTSKIPLKVTSGFPWASIGEPHGQLLKVADIDRKFVFPSEFRASMQKTVFSLACSDDQRAVHVEMIDSTSAVWRVICYDYSDLQLKALGSVTLPHGPRFKSLAGQFDIDPENERLKCADSPQLKNLAASGAELFLLRILGKHRALLRISTVQDGVPIHIHELNDASGQANNNCESTAMIDKYSEDPCLSHTMVYLPQTRTVVMANAALICSSARSLGSLPKEEAVMLGPISRYLAWHWQVELVAVKVHPQTMRTQAQSRFSFCIEQMHRTMAKSRRCPLIMQNEELSLCFRWLFHASRLWGIWMRDLGAYTIFVLRSDRFVVAVTRTPINSPFQESDLLVPTSFRGHKLPILRWRCHSWMPGSYFVLQLSKLQLRL